MFLKNDKITIELGGLVFKSHSENNVRHYRLDPSAIQGWYDGVDVRRNTSTRPVGWGDFAESGRLSSRLITISGTAVATSFAQLHQMRDEFMGIGADGELTEMTLENGSDKRYAYVTLGGKPQWSQLIDTAAAWKIDLYAPDPRIYGVEVRLPMQERDESSGGFDYPVSYQWDYHNSVINKGTSSVARNDGNVEAWPKVVVTGHYPQGFKITNDNGRTVVYTGQVTMSSPVTIDMASGTATQNGVDKSTQLSKRQWWSIPAGGSVSPVFIPEDLGNGWCDIIFRDTWI